MGVVLFCCCWRAWYMMGLLILLLDTLPGHVLGLSCFLLWCGLYGNLTSCSYLRRRQ
ncbi:hypothetical protein F5144DRAFT_574881 [Chaetomium tenue]|uniref:Uncharacterized protein n=1 Tax=Chaetomium tenue TaxID=1854479 RepID=A0ACB7P8Y1_9PEZI|nr:hypothetical protein F5144DRAFT_574881 [Chaetomium globosum]